MTKKKYSLASLFLRSTICWFISIVLILFFTVVLILMAPLPLRMRWAWIRGYLYIHLFLLKHICHLDYRVRGLEHLPKDGVGIVLCKHQSTWETFFLPIIFKCPAVIAKREILWVPFFGWGFALSDPITINRSQKSSAMQQIISKGKKCLDAGRWVIVFPEGTRIPVGMVGQYKLGGTRLAQATGYPVIPVAHNAGYFWPRRRFIKRPGTITVVIGPAIESKGRSAEEIMQLSKDWIETTVSHLER